MIKQTKQDFRIYIVLLIEVRIFFPKCSVVRDDTVVDANSGLDQDWMIVAGDDLGTVSDQTAMAHYSGGCEQSGVFIKRQIGEIGFQELLIASRPHHAAWREAALEYPDFAVQSYSHARGFLAAWFGKRKQIADIAPHAVRAQLRPRRCNESKNTAHGFVW